MILVFVQNSRECAKNGLMRGGKTETPTTSGVQSIISYTINMLLSILSWSVYHARNFGYEGLVLRLTNSSSESFDDC